MSKPGRLIAQWILAILVIALPIHAPARAGEAFQTIAPFAILMDADTGSVLFEKNADGLMAPASTTKILTAEITFHEIKEGRLKLDDAFVVSENAWRSGGAKSGGSTMFAALNSRIPIEDLIRGLVIQSGNDAAITLAEGIAGSEDNFAALMNRSGERDRLAALDLRQPVGQGGSEPEGHAPRYGGAGKLRDPHLSGVLPLLRRARVHLEQGAAVEPQSAPYDEYRGGRLEDRRYRRERLRARRVGGPERAEVDPGGEWPSYGARPRQRGLQTFDLGVPQFRTARPLQGRRRRRDGPVCMAEDRPRLV